MKFCPVIVIVNAVPPAVAEFGLSETIAGSGLDGWGGGLPPEVPDPEPAQPVKNIVSARHTEAIMKPRRFCGAAPNNFDPAGMTCCPLLGMTLYGLTIWLIDQSA